MEIAKLGDEPTFDGIDLDRVIVDPDYRRRVMNRLRAAVARPPAAESGPSDPPALDD